MSQYLLQQKREERPPWFSRYGLKFGDLLYDERVKEIGHDRIIVRRIYGYAGTGEVTRVVDDIYERSFVRFWR